MPEYLAPGVYVEEVSFRAKTIEGVSTSTAGFIGPARFGPTEGEPELLTSFADFERIYGGLDPLTFSDLSEPQTNFLAHAVRAFFEEGGRRLYVSRIENGGQHATTDNAHVDSPAPANIELRARFPGQAGNLRVTFLPRLSDNLLVLVRDPDTNLDTPQVRRIREHDTVLVTTDSPPTPVLHDVVRVGDDLVLRQPDGTISDLDTINTVRLLTVDVAIECPIIRPKRPEEQYDTSEVFSGFGFHLSHRNALTDYFAPNPNSRRLALSVPFAILPDASIDAGAEMAEALLGSNVIDALTPPTASQDQRQQLYRLEGGTDGNLPAPADYRGTEGTGSDPNDTVKTGFFVLEDIEDISIVAAPGYSYNYTANAPRADQIQGHLINHCLKMRYRIAVLDSANDHLTSEVLQYRGQVDSTHAALYYPWVTIFDPINQDELNLPPSGFVAGIYARNDVENGVHKAPANEVVRLAIGFEFLLNKAQQDILNPEGVNAFRFFEGRGYRLWGARTISSDPEWKYVNLRRYFAFLERSIEKGTQWVVFENNSERLWGNVRRTVEDFLFNEWKSGHLMGTKPDEAYFVKCDRSTMTQNDIDNGRLICLIGVSPVRPAEFVIFRIGQWTVDRRS